MATTAELMKKYYFPEEETAELTPHVAQKTGYPQPYCRLKLTYEAYNQYIEEVYFWFLDRFKYEWGLNNFDKITDIFTASEQSAFFGVAKQRLGLIQDKASQYLKGISEMVKALFQIVRELRIIDERLQYYKDTYENKPNAESSEITLKGIWIDQVEGGVKNAGSVYGLAQTVGFTILPDLFFRIRIKEPEDIDRVVNALEFNEKVKEVLKRKLRQFCEWKKRTHKELQTRRNFVIKYLRQHYDTIKLYLGWVKPYLRDIKRLQMDAKKTESAELITAFEGAILEIEVLAYQEKTTTLKYYPCVLMHCLYRARPSMTYMQEGYQRGPAYVGKYEMTFRGYVWSKDQITNYKRMKEEEDLELLTAINESIKEAMDALGDELKKYLIESGEQIPRQEEKKPAKMPTAIEPFTNIFSGFGELFGPLFKMPEGTFGGKKKKEDIVKIGDEKRNVQINLRRLMYQCYKDYKKTHGMMNW